MENTNEAIRAVRELKIGKIGTFCTIHIHNDEFEKLFVVQEYPEFKIWFKDKEITPEKLVEILSNAGDQ